MEVRSQPSKEKGMIFLIDRLGSRTGLSIPFATGLKANHLVNVLFARLTSSNYLTTNSAIKYGSGDQMNNREG